MELNKFSPVRAYRANLFSNLVLLGWFGLAVVHRFGGLCKNPQVVIDEVDTHQRLVARPLRSLLPTGVIQELYGLLIAHYAIRFLMHQAALEANLDPDRLSFVHALEVVRGAVSEFQMVDPAQTGQLYTRLLVDMASMRLPEPRLRSNPRVVKQKMSNFKLKRAEHQAYYRRDGCFAQVIAVI